MENNVSNINNLDNNQKVNYVKNLLFNNEINDALDILIQNEKKDLVIINIIFDVLNEELIINRIKQQCNLNDTKNAKLFVCSKILSILSFYNKTLVLNKFLKSFDSDKLKSIAIYEYQNKTAVSFDNKIFNKYCLKYKSEALTNAKISEEEILMLDEEKEKYNNITSKKRNNKKLIISLIFILTIISIICVMYYNYSFLINKYKGSIYPGIYINNIDLTGKKINELKTVIENETNRIENGTIIISNINENLKFTYKEIGILIKDNDIEKEIIKYNNNLSFVEKIKRIKNKSENKIFYLNASYDDSVIDNFLIVLEEKLNKEKTDDGIKVDENYNVYYDKGTNGFTLDTIKTKENIKKALVNLKEEIIIASIGKTVKKEVKYESLSSINKKVSSFTTYFLNQGNRGHNISLASSRLNNTILMPGEEFSYLKVVGPYGASNGYKPAPIYLNGVASTANGGGVCQLASTLYMAQLKAGLQTIIRRNHSIAPTYVPKGLDATVYSTSTNYKFKNNYSYPFYIVSYVKGNYLTVDIWSNENALGGKTYEPYAIYSNGGYLAYLKVIENGKVIETKYLDKSYYKK